MTFHSVNSSKKTCLLETFRLCTTSARRQVLSLSEKYSNYGEETKYMSRRLLSLLREQVYLNKLGVILA